MSKLDSPLSLGTDNISRLLMRYALPAIIAQVSASLYNIIDSIFIGQGVGALALSGLALTMPMMNLSAAFGAMVGVGSAAMTSIRLGQGNKQAAEHILGNVVLLNVVMGAIISILGLIYLDELLYFFGASHQTLGYARDYMRIILYGNIITHLYLGLNNIMRVTGYPQKAMTMMLISVAVNCILDVLFIFGFRWGIAGSAWATVVAQSLPLLMQVFHFADKEKFLHFRSGIFRFRSDIIKNIISIGMAPFAIQSCACVVVIVVNNTLLDYGGDLPIGAYGIMNRIGFLFTMVAMGLTQGMQPIVGYNYGARKYDRVIKALYQTIGWATLITSLGFIICELFPYQVVGLFVSEDGSGNATELIECSAIGLRKMMSGLAIVGFSIVVGNFFQYIGKAKRAIIISITRQLLFIVPLLYILPPIWGLDGVWYAIPIADTTAALLAGTLLLHQLYILRRNPDKERSI